MIDVASFHPVRDVFWWPLHHLVIVIGVGIVVAGSVAAWLRLRGRSAVDATLIGSFTVLALAASLFAALLFFVLIISAIASSAGG